MRGDNKRRGFSFFTRACDLVGEWKRVVEKLPNLLNFIAYLCVSKQHGVFSELKPRFYLLNNLSVKLSYSYRIGTWFSIYVMEFLFGG